MNTRIATKRIKHNILSKLWLKQFKNSGEAFLVYCNLLNTINKDDIEKYDLYNNAALYICSLMESELRNAHLAATKHYYIKKKLFIKIVYYKLKNITNS